MSGDYITVSSSDFAMSTLILAIGTHSEMIIQITTQDSLFTLVGAANEGKFTFFEMVVQRLQLSAPAAPNLTVATLHKKLLDFLVNYVKKIKYSFYEVGAP